MGFFFSFLWCPPTPQISGQARHLLRPCLPQAPGLLGAVGVPQARCGGSRAHRGPARTTASPGDPARPRSAIPAGEQHPGRAVLPWIYIKVRSLRIIPHLGRVLEELETLCSPN